MSRIALLVAAVSLAGFGCRRGEAGPVAAPLELETSAADVAPAVLRYDGPVIDVHAHVEFEEAVARSMNEARPPTPDGFRASVNDPRLKHAGAVVIAKAPDIERTRQLNDTLIDFVATDADRIFCVGSVHPGEGEAAIAEVARIAARGCKMLKLHPNTQRLDLADPAVGTVVAAAAEAGLPILLDYSGALAAREFGDYLLLAIAHPEAQLVLAHMGATRFHDVAIVGTLEMYSWYQRNLWFDLSAVASMYADSPYEDELRWVIREVGVDRVLFGSDFPVRTTSEAIDDVERLGLTQDEMRAVFFDNAATLLDL